MSTSPGATRGRIERAAGRATDVPDLFSRVAETLEGLMPLSGWCGHTLDPATSMPTGGEARHGFRPDLVPRLLEIEYAVGDVNPFDQLLQSRAPVGSLHEATRGRPETSPRYREIVTESGYEHELRSVLRHQGRPWGALVLLRTADQPAFGAAEQALLASVSTSLAQHLKGLLLRGVVETGALPERAGLLMVGGDGSIEVATPEARRWLEQLRDHDGELPLTVRAVVAAAAEADGRSSRSRARGRSGSWVTLTAWALDDRVAVSLEAAAPHDLTSLALAAYSLSDRERQIVELVLLGVSTAQIGQRLHLSPYTVQDHLKAVFEKTGVRSRRELAADLFFRHYLPRIERGAPLAPDGWFVE